MRVSTALQILFDIQSMFANLECTANLYGCFAFLIKTLTKVRHKESAARGKHASDIELAPNACNTIQENLLGVLSTGRMPGKS